MIVFVLLLTVRSIFHCYYEMYSLRLFVEVECQLSIHHFLENQLNRFRTEDSMDCKLNEELSICVELCRSLSCDKRLAERLFRSFPSSFGLEESCDSSIEDGLSKESIYERVGHFVLFEQFRISC